MKELEFINYISKLLKIGNKKVIKGIGDDCAVLDYTREKYLLFSCDMIIEGTHFLHNVPAYQIGWKSLAVSISDIAAMGGVPRYALISCGIPKSKGTRFLKEIFKGLQDIAGRFNISIIGGDTNLSSKVIVDTTIIGDVEKELLVRRDGAKPGDLIFVTGTLGEGRHRHLTFIPRVKEARMLVERFKINAMIDLSDGLGMDLGRIASASRVGAYIYRSLIPLPDRITSIDRALYGGEDFELLFTASIKESRRIMKHIGKLPVSLIGEMLPKDCGVMIIDENGKARSLKTKGYRHL